MTDHATEKRLEAIARRLSQEQRGTEAYWELYLPDAKQERIEMTKPQKFRKKPVVIEALQYVVFNADDIVEWCRPHATWTRDLLVIHTLEGNHTALPDDWIIKGIQGEFYPCKPDIFEATYEPAD
jgi:hypothetical protein